MSKKEASTEEAQPEARTMNALKGEIALAYRGKTFKAIVNYSSMFCIQEQLGPLGTILRRVVMDADYSMDDLVTIIHQCLLEGGDRGIPSPDQFREIVVEEGLAKLFTDARQILSVIASGTNSDDKEDPSKGEA